MYGLLLTVVNTKREQTYIEQLDVLFTPCPQEGCLYDSPQEAKSGLQNVCIYVRKAPWCSRVGLMVGKTATVSCLT